MSSAWVLAAALVGFGICEPDPPGDNTPLYEMTMSRFALPVKLAGREGVIAVELYVSSDQGQKWSLSRRIQPADGKFEFVAETAGEYWFAPRVLFADGRASPADTIHLEPNLRVRVTIPEVRSVVPPPLITPPATSKAKLGAEVDRLTEDSIRLEMRLIHRELHQLAKFNALTPEVTERLDVLRTRLAHLGGLLKEGGTSPPVGFPTALPGGVLPPPSPGNSILLPPDLPVIPALPPPGPGGSETRPGPVRP